MIDEIVAALDAGEVVLLPTDTVYGLAVRAADHQATARHHPSVDGVPCWGGGRFGHPADSGREAHARRVG